MSSYYIPKRKLPLKTYVKRGPRTKLPLPNPRTRSRSSVGYCSSPDLIRWVKEEISGWTGKLTTDVQKWTSTTVSANPTQTFVDDTGPKYIETSDVAFDGKVDFSYPAFKSVTNTRRDFYFTKGIGCVLSGYFPDGSKRSFRRVTYSGNPVFMPVNTMFRSSSAASVYGLCLTNDAIRSQVSSVCAATIKNKLLNDQSLLNFRDTFSILTFIAELGDLKSLPSLLKKWTRTSHDISDKYLGVQFGVLPFYSDICSILHRLQNLGPEIDRWNEMAQTCEVRNFHINIPIAGLKGEKNKDASYTASYRGGSSAISDAYVKPTTSVYFHSTCTQYAVAKGHVYLIPRAIPADLIGQLRAQIWGLDDVLGTIWEKIPFSFVVDWFTGIGKLISEFEKSEPLLQYRVLSAGYSVRVHTVITSSQGRSYDDADFGALTCSESFYFRDKLDPKSLFVQDHNYGLDFKLLNESQTILGTALLHQLLKR